MTTKKTFSRRMNERAARLRSYFTSSHRWGVLSVVAALLVLSAASGTQPDNRAKLFTAGEVAAMDVVADRPIQVEDAQATQAKRDQVALTQPTAFDLSGAEIGNLRERLFEVFRIINDEEDEQRAQMRHERAAGRSLAQATAQTAAQTAAQAPEQPAALSAELVAEQAAELVAEQAAGRAAAQTTPQGMRPDAVTGGSPVIDMSGKHANDAAEQILRGLRESAQRDTRPAPRSIPKTASQPNAPAASQTAAPTPQDALKSLHMPPMPGFDDTGAVAGEPLSDELDREERLRQRLFEVSGASLSPQTLRLLTNPKVQAYVLEKGLSWLETHLLEGVVADARSIHAARSGVLVRNMDTGLETLRPQGTSVRDIPALLASFSQFLRTSSPLSLAERRAVNALFSGLVMPTLTINREATQSMGVVASQNVEPVYYRINKGEVVVHRGERVTREQQLKLQSLYRQGRTFLRAPEVVGVFILSLVFAVGLFVAPSGKPSSPMRRRDMYFIAFLLLSFGLAAKGLHELAPRLMVESTAAAIPFAFPVAAGSGLAALIFASRRYCVTGLLLSLFSTLMMGGGLPLFLFYFLTAMLNTWLIMRAQNRQDVVRSVLPLCVGIIPLGVGAAMLGGFALSEAGTLVLCLGINVTLTLFILFAISPVLEFAFGYTTRFRLMELMNLEQPLMQELMVTVPGTYHHSLVVSNMVEAGAKAVGANSLLCKVAALYHDIGKLQYPDYFIENQFGGPNRHDKLAPAMSALILGSHVKKGVELAVRNRLGEDIEDIIRQHHGTSIMKYFYQKALELSPHDPVGEEDFRYPGPRPQSREAAIVMVADMVEASSRTLSDPTPARIKTHIDTILKNIFAEGQLDESELTFRDLHKLSENFARILTGLFHQRIAYPDSTKGKGCDKAPEKAPEASPGDASPAPEKAADKPAPTAPDPAAHAMVEGTPAPAPISAPASARGMPGAAAL